MFLMAQTMNECKLIHLDTAFKSKTDRKYSFNTTFG